ncbi:Tfp pilus assembly protein FimT/FimU [Verrucomicrobiota bacterium]
MATNSTNRSRHAFSLMELLLVVAITLILSAVSIPVFVRSLEGNQLKTAARSINRMHRYARAMSVLKGTEMAFEYNSTNRLLTVSAGTNTVPLIKREIPEKVTLESFTLLPDEELDEFPPVFYSTSGQCVDYAITLTDTREKRITVEIDGIAGSARFKDE